MQKLKASTVSNISLSSRDELLQYLTEYVSKQLLETNTYRVYESPTIMQDKNQQGIGSFLILVGVILLPVLYVLSIGPVAWSYEQMGWTPGMMRAFYLPVVWLHEHTFLKEPLEWYLRLFGVH